MCCSGARWKREEVPDHKWDFVDVREFHNSGLMSYLQYAFLYVLVIKSVLVYASDIYTMVLLLASNHWAGSILMSTGGSSAMNVPFKIGKWIFFGCIIFSFLLLLWEAKKSRAIIRSRDISYAFTNVMAINNSKKKKDDFAFFVFFTFKGWKRLLLADAPRQVINGITLYSFARSVKFTTDISKWYDGSFAKASVLLSMAFTVTIWIGSFVLLMAAAFLYVPLLCYIQGNLKEYCCHKVDKRIAELMKRKHRKRLAKEAALMRKEAMGDYSHLKDKKGQFKAAPLPQPTLPQIGLHELIMTSDTTSDRTGAASIRAAQHPYPPPSSLGHQHYHHHYPDGNPANGLNMGYNNMINQWPSDQGYGEKAGYAESITSTRRLVAHQAPIAGRHGHPHDLRPLAYPSSLNHAPPYSSGEDPSLYNYASDKHALTRRSATFNSEYGGYSSEYGGGAYAYDQQPLPAAAAAAAAAAAPYHHDGGYAGFDFGDLGPPLSDRDMTELYGTGAVDHFDQAFEVAPSNYSQSSNPQQTYHINHGHHPYSRSGR